MGVPESSAAQAGSLRARVLLFDLDETLILDEEATQAALAEILAPIAERYGVDASSIARSVQQHSAELWCTAATFPYCYRIGISAWEGMWARFDGAGDDMQALREWAPIYRRRVWTNALAEHGLHDAALADELAEAFLRERRLHQQPFSDAAAVLAELRPGRKFGMITNGASDLQREKIAATGLAHFFDEILVSGEVGIGKPEPGIFHHALQLLQADASEAVMVGDKLERDVAGALASGIRAVWINPNANTRSGEWTPDAEVGDLTALRDLLGDLP
jgi:putative hydrolase of the HAD superfamily